MGRVHEYVHMTMTELDALDRHRTVFLMALSPMEAHGPHLPLGTDLLVAEELVNRYIDLLQERHPELDLVRLPSLTLGADLLPRVGSLTVAPRVVERVLDSYVTSLAAGGFRYLFVADNHGGPRHLLACEAAARRARRRHGFYLVNPFSLEFSMMMTHNPTLLGGTGLGPGTCGDIEDLHAGTNETSLALATDRSIVRDSFCQLPRLDPPSPGALFRLAAMILRTLGAKGLAREISNLGTIIRWAADESAGSYIGAPAAASAESGETMLQGRLAVASDLFDRALKGDSVAMRPPLWPLRVLRLLPLQ